MKKTSTKMYYFPYFQGRVPAWNLAGLLPPDPTSPGPGGPSPGAVSAPGGLAHPLPHYSGAYGSQPATPVHYSHLLPQGKLLRGIEKCWRVAWFVVQTPYKAQDNSFSNNFSLFKLKSVKEVTQKYKRGNPTIYGKKWKKYLVKLSYSSQKLLFWTIFSPYKLCVTGKRFKCM